MASRSSARSRRASTTCCSSCAASTRPRRGGWSRSTTRPAGWPRAACRSGVRAARRASSTACPARNYPGVDSLARGVDLVIVRENTEGFYPDRNMHAGAGEFMPSPDVALSVAVFTRRAAERIAHAACRLAMGRRRRVSIVHKANVLTLGMGLFRDTCRAVAREYPEVRVDDYHVDAMAAHLVRRAAEFDVLV